jgi:ferrous iron transport protein A
LRLQPGAAKSEIESRFHLCHPPRMAAAALRVTDAALPVVAAVALADLEPGAGARVESVDPGSAIGRRLLDLGFVPGTEVRVVRRAPLGDPVEYELRGYRLCLRRSEALQIRVQRV